jgi:aspartokinase
MRFGDLTAPDDTGEVSIVGAGMRPHPGVAANVFAVLAELSGPGTVSEEQPFKAGQTL